MANKKAKRATISAKLRDLIASASGVGFASANAFEAGVQLARDAVKALPRGTSPNKAQAMIDLGLAYKAGYIARRLKGEKAFEKRWGNYSDAQMIEEAKAIYAKPYPDSSKPNRRTELEHKACRAADTSWTTCKTRAGIVSERKGAGGRKPRPSANKGKAPPVDLVKAAPKFDAAYCKAHSVDTPKAAANDYFATAAAALLATVNKNAKQVDPRLSSAVTDFHGALKAIGLIATK